MDISANSVTLSGRGQLAWRGERPLWEAVTPLSAQATRHAPPETAWVHLRPIHCLLLTLRGPGAEPGRGRQIPLNQGDVLLAGTLTPLLLVKVLVTPCVPFCVSLFGAYAAYRSALADQQETAGMT